MLKYLVGCFCLLFLVYPGLAQVITPLDSYPALQQGAQSAQKRNARTAAEGDTLSLPFFDDFAAYTGKPSSKYWLQTGDVYINNEFGVNPPSIHVATFEGLTEAGLPYSNFASYGYTDVLTSKPIALHDLNPAGNVLFSFYWQAGGLGGSPDMNSPAQPSFLEVEFKNKNGTWVSVWRQNGEGKRTDFAQVIIAVNNAEYFFNGFQFRFRSSGARKGTGDTWNVDYVYLDKNRDPARPNPTDIALSQRVNSLLERYTAMPANQFFVQPAAELNDSLYTRLNSFSGQFAAITWRGFMKVLAPATPADTFLRGNAAIPPFTKQYLIFGKPNASALPNTSDRLRVKHTIFLNTREPEFRFRQNDTVSRITELHDYYAYDDGTAEANFSLNNFGNRQLAYRFDLNKPDHVRAIRVYITKTNTPGTIINFRVWDEDKGRPAGAVLAQKSFVIPPVDSLNRFYDIVFSPSVAVTDTFYIGYSLTAGVSDFVNIGFDLNEKAPGRIRYNNPGTGWLTFNDGNGALMMRPVMGLVTGTRDDFSASGLDIKVYPNPSSGIFKLEGKFEELLLTDVTGRVVFRKTNAAHTKELDLRHLGKGLYLLHITQKNKSGTKKLVITD